MSEEHFVSFHLSGRSHIIGFHVVSHGTPTASLVHAREVYKSAILSNAHTIIVAHNHPGGSLTPSEEDIQTTRQLIQAGQLLGVQLLDHIIVSYNGMASIREQLPNLWQEGT